MSIIVATADIEQVDARQDTADRRDRLWRVFDATCDGLYRFILVRLGGNRDAADDLIQQTCCLAAKHRTGPAEAAECEAWLRGIARNLIRDHWRRQKKSTGRIPIEEVDLSRQLAEDMETHPLPLDVLAREELRDRLLLAVTTLPAAEQELIFAFYFDGRSQADIADKLGVTVKSIEAKLYRARHRLRAFLRDPKRSNKP